jgi:epoxyqueuosine reductase
LVEAIKHAARALGFSFVGVAAPDPPDPDGRFLDWLSAGYHADLDYLARRAEERRFPEKFFPNLRAVIALGVLYRHETPPPEDDSPRGQISCYAQGSDYHRVVIKKVRKLREEIARLAPGAALYGEVDTGPVLEKVWAQRAGLGWIGKHSNLLTRQGSWLFLASIFTDLDLPPDPPGENFCGSCVRCLDACPTQAIVAPGVVDARLCISFLTIENKRGIPRELRAKLGAWIFGCDDCQTVCPWQKFDPGSREEKFRARPGLSWPSLLEILSLDETAMTARFQGTPVARAGRRGLRRNVLVALGNQPNRAVVPALRAVLESDSDAMLRGHAAWALGRLGDRASLLLAAQHETDAEVLEEIGAALSLAPLSPG